MFAELFAKLPDGPMWFKGKYLKQLAAALDKDRVQVVSPDLQELPAPDGRFIALGKKSGNLVFLAAVQKFDEDDNEYFEVQRVTSNGTGTAYDDPESEDE